MPLRQAAAEGCLAAWTLESSHHLPAGQGRWHHPHHPCPLATCAGCFGCQRPKRCPPSLGSSEQPPSLIDIYQRCQRARTESRLLALPANTGGKLASSFSPYSLGKCQGCQSTYLTGRGQRRMSGWEGNTLGAPLLGHSAATGG